MARIRALAARLLGRRQPYTAPADSLDSLLASGAMVIVPGLSHWLGLPEQPDVEPEETWEALCARISRTEAAS